MRILERHLTHAGDINCLNQVGVADITYIRVKTGFVYLAAVLDLLARRVIGHALSTGLNTTLALKALRMATAMNKPAPGNHSPLRSGGAVCFKWIHRRAQEPRIQNQHDADW